MSNILWKDKKSTFKHWPQLSLFHEGTMVFLTLHIYSQVLLPFPRGFLLPPISNSLLAFSTLILILSLITIPHLHVLASALYSFIPLDLKWLATGYLPYGSVPCQNHIHACRPKNSALKIPPLSQQAQSQTHWNSCKIPLDFHVCTGGPHVTSHLYLWRRGLWGTG